MTQSTVSITGYTGSGGNVAIPATIDGLTVTRIGDAFGNDESTKVTSLALPESLIDLGNNLFFGCRRLTNITVNARNPNYSDRDGVLFNKGQNALLQYPAARMGSYAIPHGVTAIGDYAFSGCARLANIILPNGVAVIGDQAFSQCASLTNISLPGSVVRIGGGAFYLCSGVSSMTLPKSVCSLGDFPFQQSGLVSLTIDTSVIGDTFSLWSGLSSSSLKNLTIGNSVISIGRAAFKDCSGLTNLSIGNSVANIAEYAFWGCSRLRSLILPSSVRSIEDRAFSGCTSLTNIVLADGVSCIGADAFSGCRDLTSVAFPSSVSYIGDWGFAGCRGITALYFAGNAPTLGPSAFQYDTNAIVYYVAGTLGWGSTFGGLPTAVWQPSYTQWAEFSGLVAKYPTASGEQDDPDQDGLTNIQEMAAGTDPTERTSALVIEALARPNDLSQDDKTPVEPSQFALYFRSVPGKTYEIQSTDDLDGSWTTAAIATATTTQKRVLLSRPAARGFYRVVIR